VQTSYAQKLQFIGHILSLTVKVHAHSDTHGQLRKPQDTYVRRGVRDAHFMFNRAFRVIQGHLYWWQHKSRTGCRRYVQNCRDYFWNIRRWSNGKTAKSSISTTPLRFDDSSPRKAFEYLQVVYTAGN